jgi:hypothetical protein
MFKCFVKKLYSLRFDCLSLWMGPQRQKFGDSIAFTVFCLIKPNNNKKLMNFDLIFLL